MKDTRFIKSIRLRNLLSFGPESEEIELRPLNVLIGPNASGKSNFIEAIDLLRNTPRDISEPIRQGGGIKEWLWKGVQNNEPAIIETELSISLIDEISIFYKIAFSILVEQQLVIDEEIIENIANSQNFYFRNQNKEAKLLKINLIY